MNKEERNEYAKKYRKTHKDKIRKYQKQYWAEHGEEINAKRRNRKAYKYRIKKAIEYNNKVLEIEPNNQNALNNVNFYKKYEDHKDK